MGTGKGLVLADGDLCTRGGLFHHLRQELRIPQAVAVGDIDLRPVIADPLFLKLAHQVFNGLSASAHLGAGNDMSRTVPIENRLDIEHGADHGGHARNPAGGFQVVQIIHRKILTDMGHFGIEDFGCFMHVHVFPVQPCREQSQHAVPEAASVGIHNMHKALLELIHQFLGGIHGCTVRPADARAHGDINDIDSLLQEGRKMCQEQIGVQKTGLCALSCTELIIEGVSIKTVHIAHIRFRFSVQRIMTGQKRNPIKQFLGQIRAAVCEYGKRHKPNLQLNLQAILCFPGLHSGRPVRQAVSPAV